MIKNFFVLLIGLFLIASISLAQGTAKTTEPAESTEPVAYINYVEGKALFRDFQEVGLNMIIQENDEINTINGRVEILLKNDGVIRLDRETRIIFSTLNDRMIVLEIWNGNVYVKKGEFEVGIKTADKSFNMSQPELYLVKPMKDFDEWNRMRTEELNQFVARYNYRPYDYWRFWNSWYWYGYWYGWCWPGFSWHYWPHWYIYSWYRPYYPQYYYHRDYGYPNHYRSDYRATIHKNQLSAPRTIRTINSRTIKTSSLQKSTYSMLPRTKIRTPVSQTSSFRSISSRSSFPKSFSRYFSKSSSFSRSSRSSIRSGTLRRKK